MSDFQPTFPKSPSYGSVAWSQFRGDEARAGEARVNLIRLTAILIFYGHHLLNVFVFRDDPTLVGRYHTSATAVTLAWSLTVLAIHLCLFRQCVPQWLKISAIAADTLFITLLLCLSRDPRSSMAALYFLVIVSAGLRLSLPLVYLATLAAMAAYAGFLGYDYLWFEAAGKEFSRTAHVIFLLSLAATGILTGQMIRQVRRLARCADAPRLCPCCQEPLPAAQAPREGQPVVVQLTTAEARRDNAIVGVGLAVLGVLMALALTWPASNGNLDADSLVGLGFGLVLLVASGMLVWRCNTQRQAGDVMGAPARIGSIVALPIVLLAALVATAISILKTFY